MIVEFATAQIRIRCTREEYDELVRGRSVELDASLPGRRKIAFNVASTLTGGWRLEADPTGVWLSLPRDDLRVTEPPVTLAHEFAIDAGSSLRVRVEFTPLPG